jgi:hypothetical protein
MSDWNNVKSSHYQRKAELDSKTNHNALEQKISRMNAAIFRYTQTAGISQNPNNNSDYEEASSTFKELSELQKNYMNLNKTLLKNVRALSDDSDTRNKLHHVGKLNNDIKQLEKELQTTKKEAETATARQYGIQKTDEKVSYYQGFSGMIGFVRPLHPFSVPFLIAFGLIFLFFSALLLREMFTPIGDVVSTEELFSLFTDTRFYAVMAGLGLISVVILVLAFYGKLGKNL